MQKKIGNGMPTIIKTKGKNERGGGEGERDKKVKEQIKTEIDTLNNVPCQRLNENRRRLDTESE